MKKIMVQLNLIVVLFVFAVTGSLALQGNENDKENCAVPIETLGQVFAFSGASGGFEMLTGQPQPKDFDLGVLGANLVQLFVVDFFEGNLSGMLPEVFAIGSGGRPMPTVLDEIPGLHGFLVLNHIQALLEQVQPTRNDLIQVIPVDIDVGMTSREIVALLNQKEVGFGHTIVNMSFALVPCDKILETDYEAAIQQMDVTNDPLYQYITRNSDSVYVAAAGNSALGFAFYPALWNGVIGVGAAADPECSLSRYPTCSDADADFYSNFGSGVDVWEYGGWYQVTDPYGHNGIGADAEVSVRGTSFAAPTHAVRLALDMSQHAPGGAGPATPDWAAVSVEEATIQVVMPFSDPVWENVIMNFQAMFPQARVEYETIAFSDYPVVLAARFMAGEAPDVVWVGNSLLSPIAAQAPDGLLDLSPFLTAVGWMPSVQYGPGGTIQAVGDWAVYGGTQYPNAASVLAMMLAYQ